MLAANDPPAAMSIPRLLSALALTPCFWSCAGLESPGIPYFSKPEPAQLAGYFVPSPEDPHPGHPINELFITEENDGMTVYLTTPVLDGGEDLDGGGPGHMTPLGSLAFDYSDSCGNTGTGEFRRSGDRYFLDISISRTGDRRCLPFYGAKIMRRNIVTRKPHVEQPAKGVEIRKARKV